jgi:hypothetical protein
MEQVTLLNLYAVALLWQQLAAAVGALQKLDAAGGGQAVADAPRIREPAIIVN